MLTICVTASSYMEPVTRALSALVVLIPDVTEDSDCDCDTSEAEAVVADDDSEAVVSVVL